MTRVKLWKYTPQNEIMLPYTQKNPQNNLKNPVISVASLELEC